jgi:hypothetical protein
MKLTTKVSENFQKGVIQATSNVLNIIKPQINVIPLTIAPTGAKRLPTLADLAKPISVLLSE